MKKKIVTILAFVMLAITTTFAADNDGISKNALTTFSGAFAKATEVKWEKNDTYYTVAFQMNGQALTALIAEEGDMIAVSRNMLSTELPIQLQASLNKNFSAYWISDLAEYTVADETRYYVTIDDADKKITLQNIGTYDWTIVRKNVK